MVKNTMYAVHSVLGLFLGIFILLISISGAALIFHADADRFQKPVITDQYSSFISVDSGYKAIQAAYPASQISSCEIPESPQQPFSFFIYDSAFKHGTKVQEIYLHPGTAVVIGSRGGSADIRNNFMGWLSTFHNSFHAGKTGEWLLGFFALIFLLSIVTGIILYRESIVAVLLLKKGVYKRANLHQIIAVYALFFNLMIAVSGFWMQRYVFKKEFYATDNYTPVLKTSPPLSFHFDSANTSVKNTYPDFTARVIYFAQSNKGKTAVYGNRSRNAYIHSKKFADVILLDSAGKIAATRFINEIDAADRYDIINSQLHMGKYGGFGIKFIYFVFGLSGAFLSVTGFLIWWKRRKK